MKITLIITVLVMMTLTTMIIIIICVSVLQVGIITSCETVRDGEVSTFTGIVYKVNVSSPCSSGPNRIMFQVRYPNELTEDLCVANLSSCNKTENDQGCSCVSEEADAYIFEVNFRFNKSKHEGSKLIVMSDCSPKLFGIFNSEPCDLKGTASNSLSLSLSLSLSFSLSLSLCVTLSVCLSVSVCLCLSLSYCN